MGYTLQKTERLKSEKIIKTIFSSRKSVACQPIRLIWNEIRNVPCSAACFSVSKKNFKRAVDRNRIKRLMREIYRTHRDTYLNENEKTYGFILIYNSHSMPTFLEIEKQMDCVFHMWNEKLKKC